MADSQQMKPADAGAAMEDDDSVSAAGKTGSASTHERDTRDKSSGDEENSDTDSCDSEFEDALDELVAAAELEIGVSTEAGASERNNTSHSLFGAGESVELPVSSLTEPGDVQDEGRQAAEGAVNEILENAMAKLKVEDDASQQHGADEHSPVDTSQQAESPGEAEKPQVVGTEGEDDDHDNDHEDEKKHEEDGESSEDERLVVDEELLREREANLTDEQKQELKEAAQTLKAEGNRLFKEGNYMGAVLSYSEALRTCPLACAKERSIMYSNRAACKMHMDQKESAIEDCSKALELNANYLKCLLRRAELYEKTEKLDEALTDYQKAVEMDPSQYAAREACMRLPDQIKERNEKLKEEMMGKLKDLGNLVLRPFGLSTNNFQFTQDPNTGGYSVSFQQNPGNS